MRPGDSFVPLSWWSGAMMPPLLFRPLSFVFVLLSFLWFYFHVCCSTLLFPWFVFLFLYSIPYFDYHIYNFQRFFFCNCSLFKPFFLLQMQYFLLLSKDINYNYFTFSPSISSAYLFCSCLWCWAISSVAWFYGIGYTEKWTPKWISSSVPWKGEGSHGLEGFLEVDRKKSQLCTLTYHVHVYKLYFLWLIFTEKDSLASSKEIVNLI